MGFTVVNFPYMDRNIPTKPAHGIYISQLVRIGHICDKPPSNLYASQTRIFV